MVPRGGGDVYHLAAQPFDEGPVLRLRVDYDDIVIGGEGQIDHLPLGGEGLAGAGHAQHEAVSVEQFFPVCDDEILADDVLPVVHAALIPDFLGLEGHEHCQSLGGQGA